MVDEGMDEKHSGEDCRGTGGGQARESAAHGPGIFSRSGLCHFVSRLVRARRTSERAAAGGDATEVHEGEKHVQVGIFVGCIEAASIYGVDHRGHETIRVAQGRVRSIVGTVFWGQVLGAIRVRGNGRRIWW